MERCIRFQICLPPIIKVHAVGFRRVDTSLLWEKGCILSEGSRIPAGVSTEFLNLPARMCAELGGDRGLLGVPRTNSVGSGEERSY